MLRGTLAGAIGAWLTLQGSTALADPAAAEALFREGRSLLEGGDVNAACEKLEASNALEPSSGTLLNLATCRLRQGKTATAWAHFVSASRFARIQNRREHLAEAERRRAELEPRLSTLTLQVIDPPPGLQVLRGDRKVDSASFGVRIPIDPGDHRIEASAPGYVSKTLTLTFALSAQHRVLELPKLSPLPAAEPAVSEREGAAVVADRHGARGPGALPWVIGGVGAAALVTGGVFGALALASDAKAKDDCPNRTDCSSTALDSADRRDREALISTIGVGVGVVGLGVAALWLLGSAPAEGQTAAVGAEISRGGALLALRGGF